MLRSEFFSVVLKGGGVFRGYWSSVAKLGEDVLRVFFLFPILGASYDKRVFFLSSCVQRQVRVIFMVVPACLRKLNFVMDCEDSQMVR